MDKKTIIQSWNVLSKYRTELMGIAILNIMIYHCILPLEDISLGWFKIGWIGVEFFLFLSGIGCYYSLSKHFEIVTFYKRRLNRLIFAWIFIAIPFYLYRYINGAYSFGELIERVTTLSAILGHSPANWFIAIILICYLVAPFYYNYLVQNKKNILFTPSLVFLFSCLLFYLLNNDIFLRFSIFILGMNCGSMVKNNIQDKTSIGFRIAIGIIGVLLISWLEQSGTSVIIERLIALMICSSLLFLWCFILDKCKYLRLPMHFLGEITLEIYLLHELICLWICNQIFSSVFIISITSIIMAIAVSFGVHTILKKYIIK